MNASLGNASARQNTLVTPHAGLTVSAYDRVASLLIALLMLVGTTVVCLFIAWLSLGIFRYQKAVPVVMEELSGGGVESGVGTEGMQIDAPTVSEVARETDLAEQQLPDTLSAIVDAAAARQADLEDFDQRYKRDDGDTGGRSRGTGNRPAEGSGGGSGGGAARSQRWELRFPQGNTLESYAAQLDFFGIELALLGAGDEVLYLSKLSKVPPERRSGQRQNEQRMYMSWTRGDLYQADQDLFERAGIKTEGKLILKFIPPETEAKLAAVEEQYRGKAPKDIRRTRFGVKPAGKGFEFYVLDQAYY